MTTSGDAIAILREVSCLSPRGRYSIKIFPNYVHLHGKTFDYKIPATSMVRLFLLPHKGMNGSKDYIFSKRISVFFILI